MPGKVLDSFALIAYFRDEPGAEAVENLLVNAGRKDSPLHMTDVNYAEVKYSIVKKDGAEAWAEAAKILQGLRLISIPPPARWPTPPPISKRVLKSALPTPSPPRWRRKRRENLLRAIQSSRRWTKKSKSTG